MLATPRNANAGGDCGSAGHEAIGLLHDKVPEGIWKFVENGKDWGWIYVRSIKKRSI